MASDRLVPGYLIPFYSRFSVLFSSIGRGLNSLCALGDAAVAPFRCYWVQRSPDRLFHSYESVGDEHSSA